MATKKASSPAASTTKKTAKKATKKATKKSSGSQPSQPRRSGSGAPRAQAPKRMSGSEVAAEAARQLLDLTGKEAEGVTGLSRTEDGWTVHVEVVEVHRIPNTTDVLALYEVEVDTDGELTGYRRVRRYGRGVPGED